MEKDYYPILKQKDIYFFLTGLKSWCKKYLENKSQMELVMGFCNVDLKGEQ